MTMEVSTIRTEVPMARGILKEACALGGCSQISSAYNTLFFIRYTSYVQLIEPALPRACIRCCSDVADCVTNKGKLCSWMCKWQNLIR